MMGENIKIADITTAKPNIDLVVKNKLPISFAKKPDFMALAGIWKDKNITLVELREEAWVVDCETH
jgi:hypothetical protein